MALWELEVLDPFGLRKSSVRFVRTDGQIVAVPANGPAMGIGGISFHPRGAVLSGGGQLSFQCNYDLQKNLGIAPPNTVRLKRNNIVQGTYMVTERSHTPTGGKYALQVTCPDFVEELRRILVPGGFGTPTIPNPVPDRTEATWDIARLGQMLCSLQWETPWSFRALFNGFNNTSFSCESITIQSALGKLGSERFCSWRVGSDSVLDRVIE